MSDWKNAKPLLCLSISIPTVGEGAVAIALNSECFLRAMPPHMGISGSRRGFLRKKFPGVPFCGGIVIKRVFPDPECRVKTVRRTFFCAGMTRRFGGWICDVACLRRNLRVVFHDTGHFRPRPGWRPIGNIPEIQHIVDSVLWMFCVAIAIPICIPIQVDETMQYTEI